ncbi:MAG: hypothetical protein HOH43_04225, partial [Candidatus Latescibacteria bacterium]|nr:hypothetical protein [Candidatus Latescibacterota bacterium]
MTIRIHTGFGMRMNKAHFALVVTVLCYLLVIPCMVRATSGSMTTIRLPTDFPIVDLLKKSTAIRPKVGIALSGGGARGFAHIGVLMALDKAGIPVDFIAGSSMGSIVGGLYAVGYSPVELRRLALATDWRRLFLDDAGRADLFVTQKMDQTDHTIQIRMDGIDPQIPTGLSAGQKLQMLFTSLTAPANYLADGDFLRLPVPFLAVATDLTTGERVILNGGNLAEAMRASAAVPVIFSPVPKGSGLLVDGGIVEPLPVDLVREMGADVVLAVNTQDTLRTREQLAAPWDVVDQVITISIMRSLRDQRNRADVVITPRIGGHASSGFSNIDRLIALGEEAARPLIPKIREILAAKSNNDVEDLGRVARVSIEGWADSQDLRNGIVLKTRPGSPVVADMIRADLEMLYQRGKYASVVAEVYDDEADRHVRYRLTGNPALKEIKITGTTVASPDTLLSLMASRIGAPIDFRTLRQDAERIRSWYHDRDYNLTHLASFTADLETGRVEMVLDEG